MESITPKLTALNIPAGTVLVVSDNLEYSTITAGNKVTITLNGGSIKTQQLSTGENFRLQGNGALKIDNNNKTLLSSIGKDSILDLNNISLEILSNSSLSLSNGCLVSLLSYPIKGGVISFDNSKDKGCVLQAPPVLIFNGTTVKGSFHAVEAYPEWYKTDNYDWADAINMAFEHLSGGIIKLQSKIYEISKTIFVPAKGNLIGSMGSMTPDNKANKDYTTTFKIMSNGVFKGDCVMLVNYNPSEVGNKDFNVLKNATNEPLIDVPNVYPGARVANIFMNNPDYMDICGILVSGPAEFDYMAFQRFPRGIVWAKRYSDLKRVTNSYFAYTQNQGKDDYYLDFNSLGDALICKHNSFDSGTGGPRHQMIKISQCFGGEISSNIINGDVLISGCKALTFANNHMENGAQITIRRSEVSLCNNYIEKGLRPNLLIENTDISDSYVINIQNNCFIYYSSSREVIGNDGKLKTTGKELETVKQDEDHINLSEINDFDIEVKGIKQQATNSVYYAHGPRGIINLSNNLRYWTAPGLAGNIITTGIKMAESFTKKNNNGTTDIEAPVSLDKFNNKSQIFSLDSRILFTISPSIRYQPVSIDSLSSATMKISGLNSNTNWFGTVNKSYIYRYQFIWDKDNNYVSPMTIANYGSDDKINVPNSSKGILIQISGASGFSASALLRIVRETISGGIVYADVPLVNCTAFYDNGVTVGTVKWQSCSSVTAVTLKGSIPGGTLTYICNSTSVS